MSDQVLMEEPLQFGAGGRLIGILTLPSVSPRNAQELPVFVFLSAGLLHRVGPYRLHVHLARELAQMGLTSLRVDLAGSGDSPQRPGMTYPQSVAADFMEISGVLESRLGRLPLVLAGLCSGAHSAIRLTPEAPQIVGMVLLDPICFPDDGFRARAVIQKYTNPARYIAWVKRRFKNLIIPRGRRHEDDYFSEALRPEDSLIRKELYVAWGDPTREQLRTAFESIRERGGRVLSVFTNSALEYYNQAGQLGRILDLEGYQQFCTELFWPQVQHTFPLYVHRRRLIEEIKTWAGYYVRP
jgi:hypothetical protein